VRVNARFAGSPCAEALTQRGMLRGRKLTAWQMERFFESVNPAQSRKRKEKIGSAGVDLDRSSSM